MRYLIAVFLVSGLLFVPGANANSCPGADECPWTQVETFGDVGADDFRSPYAMSADADGNLYVLEQDSERVHKLDPSGASLATWGGNGSGDGKFDYPVDAAVDPATGSVYVTDNNNSRVERFDTSGKFISAWGWGVADGNAAYEVCTDGCGEGSYGNGAGQFDTPWGIATDGAHVYVADWDNGRIQVFDLDGAYKGQWPIPGGQKPERVAVDAGKVYVTTNKDAVWRFDQNGTPDNSWDGDGMAGSAGSGPGQFSGPEAVSVDGSGVYVADSGNDRVVKLSSTGSFQSAWGSAGTGDGQFDAPTGVLAAGGAVWVTDTYNHRLQRFSQAGVHERTIGKPLGSGQFYYPTDVLAEPDGGVFVADWGGKSIQRLDASGNAIARWPAGGYPLSVTLAPTGIFATFSDNHVRRYDEAANVMSEFGSAGAGVGQFNYPGGSATDADGNLYIADTNNNRVQKFSPAGVPLGVIGAKGSGDGQMSGPLDVALDAAGNVYVTDAYNHRIDKFGPSGSFISKWGGQGTGDGQFARPRGLAVDAAGNVFVSDAANHRVQEFDAQGNFIAKWGAHGSGPGELYRPAGVAIAPDRAVWVVDEDNHRIVRFCCPAAAGGGAPGGTAPPPSGGAPSPDTAAPEISVTGRAAQRTRTVRRRGLELRVATNERAAVTLAAMISRRDARRLGLRARTVGRATANLTARGTLALHLRVSARARRVLPRLARVRVVVRATAADPAGNRSRVSRAIVVRR